MTTDISEKDQAILDGLQAQREEQITFLRDGYRAVARFLARLYQANRQLLAEAWRECMDAWAHRYEVWEQYAALLGKDSVEELTDEELMQALLDVRPAWPTEEEDEQDLSHQ